MTPAERAELYKSIFVNTPAGTRVLEDLSGLFYDRELFVQGGVDASRATDRNLGARSVVRFIYTQPVTQTTSFLSKANEAVATNDADWTTSVPDKFKNESGINYEGIYKSYTELEGKLGKYGLAPESADAYEYNYEPTPEAMITLDPEVFTNLKATAHALGLSQKQFEPIAKGFDEFSKMVVAEAIKTAGLDPQTQYQKTEQALTEVWKTPEAIQANLALAHKAFNVYANDLGISVDDIGNNPATIRILAKIGASLGEDKGMVGDIPSQESYENLIYSPAFTNPHHKDHSRVRQQVEAMEARGAKLKR